MPSPRFELLPTPKPHNLDWIIAQVINNSNLNFKTPNNPEQNGVKNWIVLFVMAMK